MNVYLKYLQSKLNYFRDLQLEVSQKIIFKRVELKSELSITDELYFLYIHSDKISEKIQILEIQIQLIKKLKQH